jgi:hypothetical protein
MQISGFYGSVKIRRSIPTDVKEDRLNFLVR